MNSKPGLKFARHILFLLALAALFSWPQILLAFTAAFPCPKGLDCNSGTGQLSAIASVKQATTWIMAIALSVGILFIIIGEFFLINAAGNEEAKEKGRGMVANTIVGLFIIVVSYILISVALNFVVKSSS